MRIIRGAPSPGPPPPKISHKEIGEFTTETNKHKQNQNKRNATKSQIIRGAPLPPLPWFLIIEPFKINLTLCQGQCFYLYFGVFFVCVYFCFCKSSQNISVYEIVKMIRICFLKKNRRWSLYSS